MVKLSSVSKRWVGLLGAVAAALCVERLGIHGHPLDPPARTLWAAGLMLLPLAAVMEGAERARAGCGVGAAVGIWSLFALTESAHVVQLSPWAFAMAAVPCAAVAFRWPGPGLVLVPLLAGLPPLLRAPPPPTPAPGAGVELLLITVDTVRADAGLLSAAGLVGAPGWHTTTAIAAAPWTPPAMTSLWLGRSVLDHGGGVEIDGRISQPHAGWSSSLPAVWSARGKRTEAVVSNPYLRAAAGFGVGVDRFWHHGDAREAHLVLHTFDATRHRLTGTDPAAGRSRDDRVVALALDRLHDPHGPAFLWVHLLEPHEHAHHTGVDLAAAYASAVAETGPRVARLVAAAGDATVVVVGDHGESLGEEGRLGHGRHPAAEVVEVPLGVRHGPTVEHGGGPPIDFVDLGGWLQVLADDARVPLVGGGAAVVAGVRGQPSAAFVWDSTTHTATPLSETVSVGPPGAPPSDAVRAALHALGYMDAEP